MTIEKIKKAKKSVEHKIKKALINQAIADERGDKTSVMNIENNIEDCNTILWALEVAQIAAQDGFESHILSRFERVD